MASSIVQPVILCGGSGTRLWPLSRSGFPKQFLCLTGRSSLFQQAVERMSGLARPDFPVAPPLIVGNEDHRFLVQEQLRELAVVGAKNFLEPVGRNTAPALSLAALAANSDGNDPILVVTPADQTVQDTTRFTASLQQAIDAASNGAIVILGITPDRPETGFGYIQATGNGTTRRVERFVEKPDLATAQSYLSQGNFYWNSGMFVLRASTWLNALAQFRPDISKATETAWAGCVLDGDFVRPGREDFLAIPAESVDYAVLEHCPGSGIPLLMVPLDAGWSDLGAWDAVWQVSQKDDAGNALQGDVLTIDTRNSLVNASSRLVTLVGVDDLVVVETSDAVLVANRANSQDVKKIVETLTKQKRSEPILHRKVQRPWGWYDSIDEGGRFKVKRIMVSPGASLSLQMHYHRAEHWVVVSGTAEITNGDRKIVLSENQSTYIPLGEQHRLANPGTIPLEIIEVQSGSYLGEDDIVRFEDTYGRA